MKENYKEREKEQRKERKNLASGLVHLRTSFCTFIAAPVAADEKNGPHTT